MLESVLPEYSKFGAIRQPSGASMPGIAPTNAYLCKDGKVHWLNEHDLHMQD
jgi:crotonobetainyl-CoA:carnitine CoA-transferase CaiB-like acyl-CoA transferase